jgi:hypothetical protein
MDVDDIVGHIIRVCKEICPDRHGNGQTIYQRVIASDSLLTNGYDNGTFYSYDIHGNVDTLLQDYKYSVMSNADNRWKKISYNYDLISGKVNQLPGRPTGCFLSPLQLRC